MRFPSLSRLPKYQQFDIKPRYYDPIKEEIKERTERLRQPIEGNRGTDLPSGQIRLKRKVKSAPATSMLQLLIATILGAMVLGWLQFGQDFFYYVLWITVPSYLFYRLKIMRKRK